MILSQAIDLLGHLLAVFAGKSFSEIIECIVRFPSGISGEVLGSMLRWYERNNSDISEDVIFEVAEIALKNQLGAAHQSDAVRVISVAVDLFGVSYHVSTGGLCMGCGEGYWPFLPSVGCCA
jgi:hypothetical protein